MTTTEPIIAVNLFKFTGQSKLDSWALGETFKQFNYWVYDQWLVQELILCFEQIRNLANTFPFWQRTKPTGRKPVEERTLLISFLVKAFLNLTFRETEGMLRLCKEYFSLWYSSSCIFDCLPWSNRYRISTPEWCNRGKICRWTRTWLSWFTTWQTTIIQKKYVTYLFF